MKRVLITGGAGFIGRHLVAHLLRETDWSLTILDRLGEGANLQSVADWLHSEPLARERVAVKWHDLKAPLPAPDGHYRYIIHLAAGSHVDRSIKDPLGFVADNVTGTAHLLEFARKVEGLEKLLHFSTDEVFGAANGKAFDEYDSFHPTNPYAASKAAAEALCPAWANTYGLPIVVTRCTNVAGPGQDQEKYIPSTIAKVGRGEVVQIHSRNGTASSRKYIDAGDVAAAIAVVLQRGGVISGRGSGYYNIAGDQDHSNLDVAGRIAELMGKRLAWELVEDPPNRPRPDLRYDLDNSRLKQLGWSQRVPLESTLKRIIGCDLA
jgi:dTDP-glucose 4,6-dehydratase